MNIGDVIQTKAVKVIIQDGAGWLSYKLPKDKAYVFLLLGVDDIKNPTLNPEKILNALGWYFKEEE